MTGENRLYRTTIGSLVARNSKTPSLHRDDQVLTTTARRFRDLFLKDDEALCATRDTVLIWYEYVWLFPRVELTN